MAPVSSTAPTSEIGFVSLAPLQAPKSPFSWGAIMRHFEETPELIWPLSVRAYRLMMNDAQLAAIYAMTTLPILGYRWHVNPNGCADDIVRHTSRDFGIPILGGEDEFKRSSTLGFKWKRHVYHVLKALLMGHEYFEQKGQILDDGFWHMEKLAFRPPENMAHFKTREDGSLELIRQNGMRGLGGITIPAERLVPYLWDAEDGDWLGNPMLRACFGNFLIKDAMIRVHAINIERGGGMPWVETDGNLSGPQMEALNAIASDFRVTETGAATMIPGSKLHIERGALPDALSFIKYLDESQARRWLSMFAQLGQTETGSRALGDTFMDFFGIGQRAIATDLICEPTNDIAVRRLVEWNYGPQDTLPLIEFEAPDNMIAMADFAQAVNVGIITADEEIEAWTRETYGMPQKVKTATNVKPPAPVEEPVAAASRRRVRTTDSPFRRQLTAVETAAGLDPERLKEDHDTALAEILSVYQADVKPLLVSDLHAAIKAAGGDQAKLAQISASKTHHEKFKAKLQATYLQGHDSHVKEADTQGVAIAAAGDDDASADDRAAGLAGVLAVGLVASATTKAMSLTGNGLDASSVADEVQTFLEGLKDTVAKTAIQGAVTRAYNGGRFDAMRTAIATNPAEISASELLDENTCSPCAGVDGKDYESLEEGEADYPAGGFFECEGGDSCRGTLIANYVTED